MTQREEYTERDESALAAEQCVCYLIEVGTPERPEFIRGESNGCLVHPDPRRVTIEEAKRRAREA